MSDFSEVKTEKDSRLKPNELPGLFVSVANIRNGFELLKV